MAITRNITFDEPAVKRINALSREIARSVHGYSKVEAEMAILAAYCHVADGVQQMPAATRDKRATLVVSMGARALCNIIEQVAAIDDVMLLMLSGKTCEV